jgi:hypothetical protein
MAPFRVKTFGGTLTLVNFYFEAPLKLIIDKYHKESLTRKSNVLRENIEKIQYLAVPLGPLHGTLVCRGTPVENHCSNLLLGLPRLNPKILFTLRDELLYGNNENKTYEL